MTNLTTDTGNRSRPTGPDHGITIVNVPLPTGTPLRASCLCGWQSDVVASRSDAQAAGQQHLAALADMRFPCPSWCTSRAHRDGDEYFDSEDCQDPTTMFRTHVHEFGNAVAAVVQDERHRRGVVTWGTPVVRTYQEGTESAAEAREIAASVQAAADLLERISSAPAPAALPAAPPCPMWCSTAHGPDGWDEKHSTDGVVDTLTKYCEESVDTLQAEDGGYVEIVLDRMAGTDLIRGVWAPVHVCETIVKVNTSSQRVRTTLRQAAAINEALEDAVATAGSTS